MITPDGRSPVRPGAAASPPRAPGRSAGGSRTVDNLCMQHRPAAASYSALVTGLRLVAGTRRGSDEGLDSPGPWQFLIGCQLRPASARGRRS